MDIKAHLSGNSFIYILPGEPESSAALSLKSGKSIIVLLYSVFLREKFCFPVVSYHKWKLAATWSLWFAGIDAKRTNL